MVYGALPEIQTCKIYSMALILRLNSILKAYIGSICEGRICQISLDNKVVGHRKVERSTDNYGDIRNVNVINGEKKTEDLKNG